MHHLGRVLCSDGRGRRQRRRDRCGRGSVTRRHARLLARAGLLTGLLLATLLVGVGRAQAAPAVVGRIDFPGGQPLAVAVYEKRNKVYVTDGDTGLLHVIDGATNARVASIPVGGAAFAVAVDETYGKVYVASDKYCCTTGIKPGTGLISVIDADTDRLIKQIDPQTGRFGGAVSYFVLGTDEVRDKIYVNYFDGLGVIDAATDQFTSLPTVGIVSAYANQFAVNTLTGEAFLPSVGANALYVANGNNGTTRAISVGFDGAAGPLDVAVNERANKVYVTMLKVPGQGGIGILILDLGSGAHKFIGADDLEPLAFNQQSGRLFAGVQVGTQAAIVDGASDALRPVDLGGAGIGAVAVRSSTDRAYMANSETTFVVSGADGCVTALPTGESTEGGVVIRSIAVNQATGRVYVTNDQRLHSVAVIQDGDPCAASRPGGSSRDRAPVLTSLRITPRFAVKARGARSARTARVRVGARIRFRLSKRATVHLRIERKVRGRYRPGWVLRHRGRKGANVRAFSGRVGGRALPPGRYRLVATAIYAGGLRSRSKQRRFTIVAGAR